MDPFTSLDHVLFQLTPTRTRCDLVIFAGKLNEKLAYGLLEPFINHLRAAKAQISKGGYSITLRPPTNSFAPWFTKATLQRFVRFVSTPEVLERFVTIEREISQLENSIKSYEVSNAADGDLPTENEGNVTVAGISKSSAAKSKGESVDGIDGQEENSKARLQRVVESRKTVLRREQAMVYARALAAGFEMDNLDDLLMFSDAFGASRLREACIDFKELCKKKNDDRLWMDEIAAMQAIVQPNLSFLGTSGIVLAGEDEASQNFMTGEKEKGGTDVSLSDFLTNQDNGYSASAQTIPVDHKGQGTNPWANHFHPYLRNLQGPPYQQMAPYQGYFPGMPPYYSANMQWPPNGNGSSDQESHDRRNRKSSSKKKGRGSKLRGSDNEEQESSSESSGSGSSSDADYSSDRFQRKRHGKTSSRKVVIRNINYITSKRNGEKKGSSEANSSVEDDYLNGDALKQQVEDAVDSFEKNQKPSSRQHKKRHGSQHQDSVDIAPKENNGNKGNENWDALQQLLLREESESNGTEPRAVQVEEVYVSEKQFEEQNTPFGTDAEQVAKQRTVTSDAFLATGMGSEDYMRGKISVDSVDYCGSLRSAMKRSNSPEEVLFCQRREGPQNYERVTFSDDAASSAVIRSQTSDDWFIGKQSNEEESKWGDSRTKFVDGDYVTSSSEIIGKKLKDVIIDDSLMIQGHLTNTYTESHQQSHTSLNSDFIEASLAGNGVADAPPERSESLGFFEPDEIYMALDRDAVQKQSLPSWTPEMDFENNISVPIKELNDAESNVTSTVKGSNKKSGSSLTRASIKDARPRTIGGPVRKGKHDTTMAKQRSSFGSKTTAPKNLQKEEDRRKRMEELLVQRQKRIAERSAASGNSHIPSGKLQDGSKLQSSVVDEKKPKPVLRSSTIDRLAATKTSPKAPIPPPKKDISKVKTAMANTVSQKTTGADIKSSQK